MLVPGLLLLLLLPLAVLAADPWPDAVGAVQWGEGAGFGQECFPGNVLGPPDSSASRRHPSADPCEVVALGRGGSLVLLFLDGGVVDGPGPDFTVFENVFQLAGDTTRFFRETAFVEVSPDGFSWYAFPWDSLTGRGLAGLTPTNGAADPCNPAVSGGDSFDLGELGLSRVTRLRLTDTAGAFSDDGDSFDLDAVAVINGEGGGSPTAGGRIFPNPFHDTVTIIPPAGKDFRVYDLLGRMVFDAPGPAAGSRLWRPHRLPAGVYLVRFLPGGGGKKLLYLP